MINEAAYFGNLTILSNANTTQLSSADYDMRTPLYFAVRGMQLPSVTYIIQQGVFVNPVDRWGGTPLNYADPSSDIYTLLQSNGAILGVN